MTEAQLEVQERVLRGAMAKARSDEEKGRRTREVRPVHSWRSEVRGGVGGLVAIQPAVGPINSLAVCSQRAHHIFFLFFITLEPRVEGCKSL